ncbi:hypothetical protein [Thermoanaerobacterium thermosulfurigenes]|uniref:hypothetical protein n=1 Tax=Thermoanaerobacterium thermosulfurigenes TaxID=33950 RepID=UPI003EF6E613
MNTIEELKQIESKIDEILEKYVNKHNQVNLEEIEGNDAVKLTEYFRKEKEILIDKLRHVQLMLNEFDE